MAFQRHDYAVMRTMLLCIASAAALASVLWYFNKLYLTFLLTVIVTLLIEHLVLTRYRTTSTIDYIFHRGTASTRHDLIYFLFSQSGTPSALMKLTYPGLVWLAMTYFNIPKIELLPHAKLLPNNALALSVLAIVVTDFQRYASHVLLHRIPFLWNAHKFHHSGTDYNVMMFWRFTLAEAAFHEIMAILIVTVLFGRIPTASEFFIVTTGRQVLDLLSHSNVPWHYGWLGYIFSSPRYHKMHHSKERADYDSNYAEVFAFWDYLFGTFNRRYHADRSVADHIEIGLENGEDASINTQKIRFFLAGTWLPHAWKALAWSARLAAAALERAASRPGAASSSSSRRIPMSSGTLLGGEAPRENEKIADTFKELGLIPVAINVSDAVRKPGS